MRTCIATLTLGQSSARMWSDVFAPSWREYADRNGYAIEQITEPIREDGRHPSWQKLLLASHGRLQKYDQIIYLDHDVMISPHAPKVDVPLNKIGAVTWQGSYQGDPNYYRVFRDSWRYNNCDWVRDAKLETFADLLALAGYPPCEDHLNAGVLVFTPEHAEFLRHIFATEQQTERTSMEQAAITHWLCDRNRGICHPMDRRFNVVYYIETMLHYPFVERLYPESTIIGACIDAILQNNYFLHFAAEGERLHARAYMNQLHLRRDAA